MRLNEARFASLYRISQHRVDDEQAFLDFALAQAIELTGSRIGYLYFYDEGTARVHAELLVPRGDEGVRDPREEDLLRTRQDRHLGGGGAPGAARS